MKRFLSVMLTLCLLLALLPAAVFAATPSSGKCGSSVTWELDSNGFLTISGSGSMYYSVETFQYDRNIRKVTIDHGVTSIAREIFRGCSMLGSVEIGDTVKSIGAGAFRGCSYLSEIRIPQGVTTIEDYTFYGCSQLRYVYIPVSVTHISESAFQNCAALGSIFYSGTRTQWDRLVDSGDVVVPSGASVFCKTNPINSGSITLSKNSFVYDGTAKRPGVTVKLGSKTLRESSDYTLEYENNVNAGTAKVTATGTGDYYGVLTAEFRIERADPGLRFEKSSVTFSSLDDEIENPLTADSDGAVTYRSSNPSAVAVDSATGEITLLAGQNATITASISPTKNYNYGTASYEVISALGHRYEVRGAKEPTCTEPGYTGDEVCIDCGEIGKRGTEIPAKGHSWGEWKTTKQATASEPGTEQRTCTVCGAKEERATPKLSDVNPFIDVFPGDYYFEPVLWAYSSNPQITNGTSPNTFSPNDTCTRGQVVTFLWRAKGCPEPTSTRNPFTDVYSGDYYYKAVLWAAEKGITNGQDDTHFNPGGACTRAHVVTFLWRAEGKPQQSGYNPFQDVPDGEYYTDAVNWAVGRQITSGTSAFSFQPGSPCTRGQIATFLYRCYSGVEVKLPDPQILPEEALPYCKNLFRYVKLEYPNAEPIAAYYYCYRDIDKNTVVYVRLEFRNGSSAYAIEALYGPFGQIINPVDYYKNMANRTSGAESIHYLSLQTGALLAKSAILRFEGGQFPGDALK